MDTKLKYKDSSRKVDTTIMSHLSILVGQFVNRIGKGFQLSIDSDWIEKIYGWWRKWEQ
jgi:hypothetical protein